MQMRCKAEGDEMTDEQSMREQYQDDLEYFTWIKYGYRQMPLVHRTLPPDPPMAYVKCVKCGRDSMGNRTICVKCARSMPTWESMQY